MSEVAREAVPVLKGLVDKCNDFRCWKLPEGYSWLCLPDQDGKNRVFGILQPKISNVVKWTEHGFEVTDVRGARAANVCIPQDIQEGKVVMPKGLKPKDITEEFEKINEEYSGRPDLPGLKGEDDKDRVPLVGGHPEVKFPDKLGVYLGILQVGVHLTVYHVDDRGGLHVYVQHRSETASYGGMLDQTAAGGLLHGETVREGLMRETKEEHSRGLVEDAKAARYEGSVVFSMVRPEQANKLRSTLEISTKACFAAKTEKMWAPKTESADGNVKRFEWMTAERVVKALKAGRFKPNCALVMIRFLIDRNFLNRDSPDVQALERSLKSDIPFLVPKGLEMYGTASS